MRILLTMALLSTCALAQTSPGFDPARSIVKPTRA
jgi:hypothetical protein